MRTEYFAQTGIPYLQLMYELLVHILCVIYIY
jgi:hypothetical protein